MLSVRYSMSTYPIWTLHFRDRHGAASLRHRNRAATNRSCVWTKAILIRYDFRGGPKAIWCYSNMASPVTLPLTLTQIAKVIWEGDAHITRVLGMGTPKRRGCPYDCNSRNNVVMWKHSVSCMISQIKSGSGLITDCPVVYTVCRALHVCLITCLSFFLSPIGLRS